MVDSIDKVDKRLAEAAQAKLRDGKTPSSREQAALRRLEKVNEEAKRWEHYRSIPQKHYRELSGRQLKVLRDQAALYGLPCDGKTVDLAELLRAIHDLLARHSRTFREETTADDLQQQLQREDLEIKKLTRLEKRRQVCARQFVSQALSNISGRIRSAATRLRTAFGQDAYAILSEALDECQGDLDAIADHDPVDALS